MTKNMSLPNPTCTQGGPILFVAHIRGILFGRMKFELGDHSFIRCEHTGLVCDIEFKTKGFISGTYNAISGKIKRDTPTGEALYEIFGKWTEEMWIKNVRTGEKELLFNAEAAKPSPGQARPVEEQEERESRKLWEKVTNAIIRRDQTTATDAKSAIEDKQREETRARDAEGVTWNPRFFKRVDENFYILNHKMYPTQNQLMLVIPRSLLIRSKRELNRLLGSLLTGKVLLPQRTNPRLFPLTISRTAHPAPLFILQSRQVANP
jgi:hypothetical protein